MSCSESLLIWPTKYIKLCSVCQPESLKIYHTRSTPSLKIAIIVGYDSAGAYSASFRQHEDTALFLRHLLSFYHVLFGCVYFRKQVSRTLLIYCVIAGNSVLTPAMLTQFYLGVSQQQLRMRAWLCFEIDWLRWGIQTVPGACRSMLIIKVLAFSNSELSISMQACSHYMTYYLWNLSIQSESSDWNHACCLGFFFFLLSYIGCTVLSSVFKYGGVLLHLNNYATE